VRVTETRLDVRPEPREGSPVAVAVRASRGRACGLRHPSMMYVRVCACAGETLLSYARGFPRGPKTYRRAQFFFFQVREFCRRKILFCLFRGR